MAAWQYGTVILRLGKFKSAGLNENSTDNLGNEYVGFRVILSAMPPKKNGDMGKNSRYLSPLAQKPSLIWAATASLLSLYYIVLAHNQLPDYFVVL